MKIGIIVYSQTGNTYSVSTKLYERLLKENYSVTIERIEAKRDPKQPKTPIELIKTPDVKKYDFIVFASPVEAFSLCPVTKQYLEALTSLKGKKVACMVTQSLPYPWLGGNHAINQMKEICIRKGAIIHGTGIVNWMSRRREDIIIKVVDNLMNYIKGIK